MKRLLLLLALALPAAAQTISVYPTALVAPRGGYPTVTAIVNGVSDKTVTWTSDGGSIVGKNPCVVSEPCTISLHTLTAGTYHLTATSNADHTKTATSTVTITSSPTPRTDHPRFLITPSMLAGLQAKAIDSNPMYASIKSQATSAFNRDNAIWSWSCNAGNGQPSSDQSATMQEEGDFYSFALMSLIAPTQAERDQWGCYGHDVFLTFANYVINGQVSLLQGNEWSDGAIQITLTPDWLMGGGYLSTTADLNTTRAYLAKIAYEQINDTFNGMQAIIGSYNSPTQFDEANEGASTEMRAMGNNYTMSRQMYMTAAALTFNDNTTDDPPLANTCSATRYQVCPDGTAGSLHAYWSYLTGGMLYKDWGNMEDANVVQAAYNAAFGNLPTQPMCNTLWHVTIPCLGIARGGESSEGSSYGTSLVRLIWTMSAIHTAGYDDPILYGPQMSIGTSSYMDLRNLADMNITLGESGVASDKAHPAYLSNGDSYQPFSYPDFYASEAAELASDTVLGRTDRTNTLKWIVMSSSPGGMTGSIPGCPFWCGFDNVLGTGDGSTIVLDSFIALPSSDPQASLPTDPRASLPTDWYNPGNQHIVTRDNWTTGDKVFSYYCNNAQIDHEHNFCGGFSLYSNGEFITKGRTSYNDYVYEFAAARNQNIPAYINTPGDPSCTGANNCQYADSTTLGGQLWHGLQAGWVNLQHSELPGYVAAIADDTNEYNGSWGGFGDLNGIAHASRSLLYLRGSNQVIAYDRGDSGANVWDKANFFVTTGAPTFSGNTASWLTRSGNQKVYWTSVMPASTPTLDATYSDFDSTSNDWEIYGRLKVDAGNVTSTHFLSVMEFGISTLTRSTVTLVQSNAGDGFDGTKVGSSLVMFMRAWPGMLTSTTYPASGATSHYISDLAPSTTYAITASGAPASATTDAAGVLTFASDGSGNVTVAPSSGPPPPSGAWGIGTGISVSGGVVFR